MKQTPNYNLPQFEGTDYFDKDILNDAFSKIEIGISDIQETINSVGNEGNGLLVIEEIVRARQGEDNLVDNLVKIVGSINEKENKTNGALQTIDKTIVGAINELKSNNTSLAENINRDLNLKQNSEDSLLTTTNKTIVGAINELKSNDTSLAASINLKQNSEDISLTTTNKTIVGAINELKSNDTSLAENINLKQNSNDDTLITADKTVIGSINELASKSNDIEKKLSLVTTYVPTLGAGLSDYEPTAVVNKMVIDQNGIVTYNFCVTGGKSNNNIINGATLCYVPDGILLDKICYSVINTETTAGARGFGMAIVNPSSKSVLVYFPADVLAVSSVKGTVTFQAKFP